MSQNIIIQQSGLPSTFNVDGIRTNTLNQKKEDWVFDSSGKDLKLIKMTLGKNGIFNATDYNARAIAEIYVLGAFLNDVITTPFQPSTDNDTTVIITEGGEPRIFENVKKLRVNIPNNQTIDLVNKNQNTIQGTLYITKPGTYRAQDEGDIGYSAVRVNIEQEATPKDGSDLYNNPFPNLPVSIGTYGGRFDYHGTYVEGEGWRLEIENATEQHAPIYCVGYYNENSYTFYIFVLSKEYFKVPYHYWMEDNGVITQDYHDIASAGSVKHTKSNKPFYGNYASMRRPPNPELGITVTFVPYGKFNSFNITSASDLDLFMKDLAEIVLYGNLF